MNKQKKKKKKKKDKTAKRRSGQTLILFQPVFLRFRIYMFSCLFVWFCEFLHEE